ncbi:MAG: hypothetical protein J5892_04885 [Bacilli bacterium]|nr:hypothetical protein [Bacilli bacterium]
MNRLIIKSIKEDPKLYEYLLNNSYLITYLNRDPASFKMFMKRYQARKREERFQKINHVVDGMNMLSNIIDSVK